MNERSDLDPPRQLLLHLLDEREISMNALSERIGKNPAYLHQYINRGSPKSLSEQIRIKIGRELGVSARSLYTGDLVRDVEEDIAEDNKINIPEYNIQVSAGGGYIVDRENIIDSWPMSKSYLNELRLARASLFVCEVVGDSMHPTLHSGDRIMINQDDRNPSALGVFALWDSDALVVKRIEKIPNTDPVQLRLISDNKNHSVYDVMAEDTRIIGRVVWYARRF